MFEDVTVLRLGVSSLRSASDREILAAIWTHTEIGDLSAADLWGELRRRYPQEPRFLLLMLFESLSEAPIAGTSPAAHFLSQVDRIAGEAPELHPLLADLLVLGKRALGHDMGEREGRAFRELWKRVAPKGHRESGATARLEDCARQAIIEFHDRSMGGQPILAPLAQVAAPQAPSVTRDYTPNQSYAVGDRVEHPKFGLGVVVAVFDNKVEVRFPRGTKLLACSPAGVPPSG